MTARTLYVNRPLKNAEAIRAWAKAAGFKNTLPPADMHATVAFSKTPLEWPDQATDGGGILTQDAGSEGRSVERLGDKGAAVLKFDSPALAARWQEFRDAGASWDHEGYQPHVTITYDIGDVDLESVAPYDGPLEFGEERFGEVDSGWADKVKANLQATDSALLIALDRDSVREKTRDGRLIVKVANISKANVCPYRGREIPGWEALGLEPERIYNLLRDPEELEKAAPTLNGVQLLRKHIPVNAEDHQPYDTVGSLGTDAEFDGKYLRNSLFVNAQDAIDGIESGKKRELSAGYHYTPDMTPGKFDGKAFDGVMRDIVFNHVALVEDGRAGPDVVVGDSMENVMKPTRLAALVLATTAANIAPLLAMDSKVTLSTDAFKKLTAKNFKDTKAGLLAGVRSAIDGKLRKGIALDASMQGLAKAIDAFENLEDGVETEGELEKLADVAPTAVPEDKPSADTYDAEPFKSFLREKGMGEDDIMKACDMMPKLPGVDADPAKEIEKKDGDEPKPAAKDAFPEKKDDDKKEDKKDMIDKPAMDAALKAHGETIAKQVRETERGIRTALADVKPWVGELPPAMAFDSAADVYRHTAVMLNIEGAKTLHADALLPIIKAQTKPGSKTASSEPREMAMDASAIDRAHKIAPGLANISTVL